PGRAQGRERGPRRAGAVVHGGRREAGRAPPHDDWRRIMTWLVWRQHRAQAAIASALLAALAAVVLADGFHIASRWHSVLAGCAGNSGCLEQAPTLVHGGMSD